MSAVTLPAANRVWRAARPTETSATVRALKRIRWAVRATLVLGVAASVAANVLHAQPHLISQAIAAWPPVALLLTVELISRVPIHRKPLAATRLIATTAIAGIAAWVSYWHMVGVASRYGETGLSAYLLPVSVDGLIVVASISLVELSARLQLAQPTSSAARPAPPAVHTAPPPVEHEAATSPANPPDTSTTAGPAAETLIGDPPAAAPADHAPHDQPEPAGHLNTAAHNDPDGAQGSSDAGSDHEPHRGDDDGDDARQRRRRGATRKAVIDAYQQDPTQHPTTIAEIVGTSERTVRRYLDEFRASPSKDSPNGTNGAQHAHNGNTQ
ncbi:DUF2637 domain-containing protein [Phytohabitans aurantiacus]|uniref:DUF2637 domain-containing protein n=1 Tax=Phytohabitans aurantiacus TaxID=3016789 RepID=A0ABQ5QY03_9ACTN|nr:DUF2637 domain-containing protein [Phytohabitans aurantiacus]GLH98806.1 hypothetical protein Pa4123_40810 [Phytohabitans aurantiacus]